MANSGIPIAPRALADFVERHGGVLRSMAASPPGKGGARTPSDAPTRRSTATDVVRRLAPLSRAGAGDLAPLLNARYVDEATAAVSRGAMLLVDDALASRADVAALPGWFHPHATWALAAMLDYADCPATAATTGEACSIGKNVVLGPRVKIGSRVVIGSNVVIGEAGFGFARGAGDAVRHIPHYGGVIIEDDVHIGAGSTIASGTLGPTVIKKGAKLDAQVHVGHNCEVGEGTMIAAQTGLAGSVVVGKGVMIGGQVGIADHVVIGDGARIAGKSGIIGDIPPGATYAGYPAVERPRWLRGLAELYRLSRGSSFPPPPAHATHAAHPTHPTPPGLRPEAIIKSTLGTEPPRDRGA
ncbi:MAG: hypothetical protein JST00_33285 [Deltaproteobacteria bacterium]|nr:hypothetical protein [Deltaproteobacteria bacterium]